jgi:hypothetical protein
VSFVRGAVLSVVCCTGLDYGLVVVGFVLARSALTPEGAASSKLGQDPLILPYILDQNEAYPVPHRIISLLHHMLFAIMKLDLVFLIADPVTTGHIASSPRVS